MTDVEFLQVRQWMKDRWPTLDGFTSGQWLAYREELAVFPVDAVRGALRQCFDAGDQYPPNLARLVKVAREWARDQVGPHPALPSPQAVSWEEYAQQRWGRYVPLDEAARNQ